MRVVFLRVAALLMGSLAATAALQPDAPVSVAQLEQFLTSRQTTKAKDADLAAQLSQMVLSEELTESTRARLLAETHLGPKTMEQIDLLAAESVFHKPPSVELPHDAAPNSAEQAKMIAAARKYVNEMLPLLPDFLANRVTDCFDNTITDPKPKHGMPRSQIHFTREYRDEIAYRNGREIDPGVSEGLTETPIGGLSTWGEFGGMLKTVLNDALAESVQWDRWQRNEDGLLVAVFRYAIPEASSHSSVDFCCYQRALDDPISYPFHARPGYHGEIFLDPSNGEVHRITLVNDLKKTDPVSVSEMAVQYEWVEIGGKRFLCPVRGVAVIWIHNVLMQVVDGAGLERHANLVRFIDYHKFGSTARILTGTPGEEQQ